MRTDGIFTVHQVTYNTPTFAKPLTIVPFGDIHRDSPAFSKETWRDFLNRARSMKNVLFLGMGDYMDSYSTSEREIMYSSGLHDSSRERHEEEGRGRIRTLAKELSFMKGRLIGLLGGNHFMRFRDGTSGDQYLAQQLGCRYLGVCSAIRVLIVRGSQRVGLDIFAHHGRGAGRTAGGRFNSVEQLAQVADADIYLMGDNHARGALPMGDRLRIMSGTNGPYIRARRPWCGRTGSFLKAYEPDHSSYVADAALPPASLGWIEFDVKVRAVRHEKTETLALEIGSRQ